MRVYLATHPKDTATVTTATTAHWFLEEEVPPLHFGGNLQGELLAAVYEETFGGKFDLAAHWRHYNTVPGPAGHILHLLQLLLASLPNISPTAHCIV